MTTLTHEIISPMFPARDKNANKGSIGRGMLVAGSNLMPGASVIAAKGAINSGIGLLTLAFPDSIYSAVTAHLTEPVLLPCPSAEDGGFSQKAIDTILEKAKTQPALAVGPGLSTSAGAKALVYALLDSFEGKLILDADALNTVSENPGVLKSAKAEIGITPHPGEMSRLAKMTIDEIQKNREAVALEFAEKYSVTTLLKGRNTVIACPNGKTFVNPTGTPAMARGGCGDLLTGMVLSFAAQGKSVCDALCAGAFLHGLAGQSAAEKYGEYSATIERIAEEIRVY